MNFVARYTLSLTVVLGVLTCTPWGAAQPSTAWRVPEAALRYELTVSRPPTHPAAGLVVEIPDGGLLPEPAVVTRVFTRTGQPVESYTLWHNPARDLVMVMDTLGGDREAVVYVQQAAQYRLWTPQSGLAPSPILGTDPTQATLSSARAIATLGRVSRAVHVSRNPVAQQAPFSIAGDPTGRPRPASFYLLAHVASADPGRTWLAPFTLSGEGEVHVNGRPLTLRNRIDKWGGTGDWADIKPGPNRVEVLHIAPGTQDFFSRQTGGLMYLTWRTPNATMQELGGIRSEAVPLAGTSRQETRLIRDAELLRSGTCNLVRVQTRDGLPVAVIGSVTAKPYWFGNETPLLVYTLEALAPVDSHTYTWTFPGGFTVIGTRAEWIFPGMLEHAVALTAETPAGKTRFTYPFFAFSTQRTSLNNAADRRGFRQALRSMAENVPEGHPAIDGLDPAIWRTLLRTAEFGKGAPVLRALFTRHPEALRNNIAPGELEALQDLLLDTLAPLDDRECIAWINRFYRQTEDARRREEFTLRAAEIEMHYRHDPAEAERILRSIYRPDRDDIQRFLHIRLGDLALLQGDLNTATRHYASVQNYSRIRRSVADRQALSEAGGRLTGRPVIGATIDQAQSDDWKLHALVDAAASESIRALLDQNYLLEAREMLRLWERDLPLSKIGGDFIILESRLYRAAGDPVRASGMLRAFCETVEASNTLPEAAPLLLSLMVETGTPPETIRATGERIRKRLEFHPVAREIDSLIQRLPTTATRQEAISHEHE